MIFVLYKYQLDSDKRVFGVFTIREMLFLVTIIGAGIWWASPFDTSELLWSVQITSSTTVYDHNGVYMGAMASKITGGSSKEK